MDNVVSDLSAKAKNITDAVTKEGEIPTVYMQVDPHSYTVYAAEKKQMYAWPDRFTL